MIEYIVPALIGLIAGLAGSLIAPWIHWGIEKKRTKLESRREIIRLVRAEMSAPIPPREQFRENSVYSQIRPHLSPVTIEAVESVTVFLQQDGRGAGVNNYATKVLDDILKLERAWDLA